MKNKKNTPLRNNSETYEVDIFSEVKKNLNFVNVAKDYGIDFNNRKSLCPFHDEKEPSFTLLPDNLGAKCFGCEKIVDVISLVKELHSHNSQFDAAKSLIEKYHLPIDCEATQIKQIPLGLIYTLELYVNKAHENLLTNTNIQESLKLEKGITIEQIEDYKIGYVGKNIFSNFLSEEHKANSLELGIIKEKGNRNSYESFQNRLIFPIYDKGTPISIWSRQFPIVNDRYPKWLGLPNNELCPNKPITFSENLNKNLCIITESIPDSLAFIKAGFPSCSLLGKEVSEANKSLIDNATSHLYISFDPDKAGKEASYKLSKEFKCSVIQLGNKEKDADEILVDVGVEKFKEIVDESLKKAKTHESIVEEEKIFSSSDNKKYIHSSMNFIDGELMYGLKLNGECLFISDNKVRNLEQVKNEYYLEDKPIFSKFSAKGIQKYLQSNSNPVSSFFIFSEIKDMLNKFVIFKDDWQSDLTSLWVMGTYLHRIFPLYPFLWINSPTKRCGKTRLLELLSELCYNANGIETAPSDAVLYRVPSITAGTLLWDEAENLIKKKETGERLSILNSAYRRQGYISRCDGKENKVKQFSVFRPIVLAGINYLEDATADRAIKIELIRKKRNEKVERLQIDRMQGIFHGLRDNLHIFALNNANKIYEAYSNFKDEIISENVDDRLKDGLEILYSIAAVVLNNVEDKDTIKLFEQLKLASIGLSYTKEESEDSAYFVKAIDIMREHINSEGLDEIIITSEEAVQIFNNGGIDWVEKNKDAQSLLRKMGSRSQTHRKGHEPIRGYKLTKKQIEDLSQRWGSSIEPQNALHALQK